MRRKKADREEMLEKHQKLYNWKDISEEEEKDFSNHVRKELQSIEDQKILGTWGEKGKDIRYDPHVFGSRCRAARIEKKYSQEDVARRLGCNAHSYISGVESGRVKVDILMLEELSLLYRKMPQYLLGITEEPLKSSLIVADRVVDEYEFFIFNSLFDPEQFVLPTTQNLDDRIAYINDVAALGRLPDYVACDLIKISEILPALQKMNEHPSPKAKYEYSKYEELIASYEDYQERMKVITARCELHTVLDNLCNQNPEWLIFIAKVMAEQPELISLLRDIAEKGGYKLSK